MAVSYTSTDETVKITQNNKNKNYKTIKISTHKTTKHSKYKYNTHYKAHTHTYYNTHEVKTTIVQYTHEMK